MRRGIFVKVAVKRPYVTQDREEEEEEEENGPAVMEQLPYCLHNSQWNSLEFADERARERERERGGESHGVATL